MSFATRLNCSIEEIKGIFRALYGSDEKAFSLFEKMVFYHDERCDELKALDEERLLDSNWYKRSNMLGLTMYTDLFAGDLRKLKAKIPYLKKLGISYLHLMPLLKMPEKDNDRGYADDDFSLVDARFGTNEDLVELTHALRENGISLCLDFVMNHTSSTHQWALKAQEGDEYYRGFYSFYEDRRIPDEYEKTMPEVFPETAPGNFVWNEKMGMWVLSTFYPYQWDLNYKNPRVFNEMMYNFLYLANQGIDVIRIDAVPYIWKELGTQCRNLPQVHTIVRMMRMIAEIVCPSVILLGEVVMEPEKVVPYFGTIEKPECHMLYNVTTMASTWHTVATHDIRLLKKQMDIVNGLPKEYVFLNYLRCHDDIGWGLDYPTLKSWGLEEISHKRYLNDFFTGKVQGSVSRGELYNDDPVTMDARFCGTTASMCGIESALYEKDANKLEEAVRTDLMLHAYMLVQSGIPMLYSGDEVGQLNDYTYKENPSKAVDSRYLHRGAFQWEAADKCKDTDTVEGKLFTTLSTLEKVRRTESVFDADANAYTYDVKDNSILAIIRMKEEERFLGIFNFSNETKTAWIQEEGTFKELLTGKKFQMKDYVLPPHGFVWAKKVK